MPVSRALRDDPWALKRWYKTHGVTVAFHTPSYLRVSQKTPFEGLRILITGGEAPTHDDARHYAESCRLVERLWPHRDLHLCLRGTHLGAARERIARWPWDGRWQIRAFRSAATMATKRRLGKREKSGWAEWGWRAGI